MRGRDSWEARVYLGKIIVIRFEGGKKVVFVGPHRFKWIFEAEKFIRTISS